MQKEHDDASTTDRLEPQLATAPLRKSHVTAQEMAQEFDRFDPDPQGHAVAPRADGQPYNQIARETGYRKVRSSPASASARQAIGAQPEMQARTIPAASRENGASVDHAMKILRAGKVKIDQAITSLEQLRPRLVS